LATPPHAPATVCEGPGPAALPPRRHARGVVLARLSFQRPRVERPLGRNPPGREPTPPQEGRRPRRTMKRRPMRLLTHRVVKEHNPCSAAFRRTTWPQPVRPRF
jgi:hypothetical protein